MLLNADGTRLFVASATTDRVAVVDTRARHVVRFLNDPPPQGVTEGSTPNALALSADESLLYVAEADANAVGVFSLSSSASPRGSVAGSDSLIGRIPTDWYPTAVVAIGDSLWVVNEKGKGSGPNPREPHPNVPLAKGDPHEYTLGQLNGSVTVLPAGARADLSVYTARVAHANGWDRQRPSRNAYPPFEHVLFIIKENRTYDQVLGDLQRGDGDSSLTYFPRAVTPNHHALAERFGIFDRFFVNAEVSQQGHVWSTAGYVTDYGEKTTPDMYRGKRPDPEEKETVDDPANGYIWERALRQHLSVRNYGEWAEVAPEQSDGVGGPVYRSRIASLAPFTSSTYPSFDLAILDQRRADAWLTEFTEHIRTSRMPALEIMHLPADHTAGGRAGRRSPKAFAADNDLALGRIVDSLSRSRYWRNTVVFVVEDDAQDGPDHVDSHRSVLLVISAWNRGGLLHRFVNTTDVLATMEEILGLEALSQFDHFGRPLRDIWSSTPDLRPFEAIRPAQSLTEMNPDAGAGARESALLDFSQPDRVDDDLFNRILWKAIKGTQVPYPSHRRAAMQSLLRER
jgi:hypothetical protein